MSRFLAKLFIKNYEQTENLTVRGKYGTLSSIVGIAVNLLLSLFKFLVGILSGSVAITADALNNLSDAGSAIVSLISFRISAKPADREHPFGHARIEYIASMIVSFLILYVGVDLLLDSFKLLVGIDPPKKTEFGILAFVILAVSILAKLWLAFFYRSVAKTIDSSVMKASMTDSLMDATSTLAVLICAVIIELSGFVLLDSIVGIAVSLLIFASGIRVLKETKDSILGEAPVKEITDQIESIVYRYPEALGIHDMLIHNYGPSTYIASFHVEVDGQKDIYELHDTIDLIEKTISEEMNILCTVHMDPIVTHDTTINELRSFVSETLKEIDPAITVHDFRAVIGKTHTNLIFDLVLPFESKVSVADVRKNASELILAKRPNHYCVITVDRG